MDVGEAKDLARDVNVPFAKGALGKGETKDLQEFSARVSGWRGPKWHESSVPSA